MEIASSRFSYLCNEEQLWHTAYIMPLAEHGLHKVVSHDRVLSVREKPISTNHSRERRDPLCIVL
jgi:hypothetical protein